MRSEIMQSCPSRRAHPSEGGEGWPLATMRMTIGVLAVLVFIPAYAAEKRAASLADLSLEELGDIEVTSVSRRAERLGEATWRLQ